MIDFEESYSVVCELVCNSKPTLLALASPGVTYADLDCRLSIILLILKCRS
jgi:hypothetical protein